MAKLRLKSRTMIQAGAYAVRKESWRGGMGWASAGVASAWEMEAPAEGHVPLELSTQESAMLCTQHPAWSNTHR